MNLYLNLYINRGRLDAALKARQAEFLLLRKLKRENQAVVDKSLF